MANDDDDEDEDAFFCGEHHESVEYGLSNEKGERWVGWEYNFYVR